MDIWSGFSPVRDEDALRAPAGWDWAEITWQIQETQRAITSGDPQVAINTGNIASNLALININIADIGTNAGDIITNAGDITTNTGDIATNTGDIGTNTGDIATNAGDIGTNTGNIATNAGDIITNAGNIATNVTDISDLTIVVGTNTFNIGTNASGIANMTLDHVCDNNSTTDQVITAGGFVGNLTGNADTVTTNANLTGEVTSVGNAAVVDPTAISGKADTTIVAADYLLFWDATDSTLKKVDAGEVLGGASTDDLDDVCDRGATTDQSITAASFIGPLTGNADTVTTNANLTGEVTSVGNAAVVDPTAISGKADTTITTSDYLLFWDATDSTLKKVDAGELLGGSTNLTGEVTSVGAAAVLDPTCISGKANVTVTTSDYLLFWDATDSLLKKTRASNVFSSDDLDDVCDRGSVTNRVIESGGFVTHYDIKNDRDNKAHYFGLSDDYSIMWDSTAAVHTISSGSFEFDGGPIRMPSFTTVERDLLSAEEGHMIYNSTTNQVESYEDTVWSAGAGTLPTGGSPEDFLKRSATGYSWTTTTTGTYTLGGLETTGSIKNNADNAKHYFGAGDDYHIAWDGGDAVHTISSGSFEFDGGPIRLPNLTTIERDALTPADGMVIYNSTTDIFEYYEDGAWVGKANAITTATTLYVKTTGNDTTGDGSSATPWATIDKAMAYLSERTLTAEVIIDIEEGSYPTTSILTLKHPQGGNISIKGDYKYDSGCTLTATDSTSGTHSDYTFTVTDIADYTVGMFVTIISASGGTNPTYCVGTLEIMSKSGSSVVLRWPDVTASASGAVSANISVPKVEWLRPIAITSSIAEIAGININYDCTTNILLVYVAPQIPTKVRFNFCCFCNSNANRYGQFNAGLNSYTYCYMVGFYNMYWAVISTAAGKFEYSGCTNCALGFYSYYGSTVITAYIHMIGITGVALTAYGQSCIQPDAGGSVLINTGTDAVPSFGTEGNRNCRMEY